MPAAPAPKSPACSQPMRSVNELWQGLSGAVVVRCLRSCTWCRRTPCTAQSHPSVKGVSVLQVVAVLILSAETILCVHVHALLCACAAPPAACVRCWLDPMAPIFLLGCRAVCVCVCVSPCVCWRRLLGSCVAHCFGPQGVLVPTGPWAGVRAHPRALLWPPSNAVCELGSPCRFLSVCVVCVCVCARTRGVASSSLNGLRTLRLCPAKQFCSLFCNTAGCVCVCVCSKDGSCWLLPLLPPCVGCTVNPAQQHTLAPRGHAHYIPCH